MNKRLFSLFRAFFKRIVHISIFYLTFCWHLTMYYYYTICVCAHSAWNRLNNAIQRGMICVLAFCERAGNFFEPVFFSLPSFCVTEKVPLTIFGIGSSLVIEKTLRQALPQHFTLTVIDSDLMPFRENSNADLFIRVIAHVGTRKLDFRRNFDDASNNTKCL